MNSTPSDTARAARHPLALWGILGVCMLLGNAVLRLSGRAFDLADMELSALHLAAVVVCVIFMVFAEGYRGFHQRFSPRVVQRALTLAHEAGPVRAALAPLFCMGLIQATRRRLIASWMLTAMIVGLIIAVSRLAAPWREIVDAGVVAGLGTGLASLLWWWTRALAGREPGVDPELPAHGHPDEAEQAL